MRHCSLVSEETAIFPIVKKRKKEKRNRSLGSSKWQPRRRTGLTSFVSLSTSEMSLPRRATKEKKVGKKRWIRVFIATAQYIFCEHGTIGPTFPPFSGSNSVRLATIQLWKDRTCGMIWLRPVFFFSSCALVQLGSLGLDVLDTTFVQQQQQLVSHRAVIIRITGMISGFTFVKVSSHAITPSPPNKRTYLDPLAVCLHCGPARKGPTRNRSIASSSLARAAVDALHDVTIAGWFGCSDVV